MATGASLASIPADPAAAAAVARGQLERATGIRMRASVVFMTTKSRDDQAQARVIAQRSREQNWRDDGEASPQFACAGHTTGLQEETVREGGRSAARSAARWPAALQPAGLANSGKAIGAGPAPLPAKDGAIGPWHRSALRHGSAGWLDVGR